MVPGQAISSRAAMAASTTVRGRRGASTQRLYWCGDEVANLGQMGYASSGMGEGENASRRQKPQTCQMFDTPLIEFFSRIHPVTPFVFWLPTTVALFVIALVEGVALPLVFGLFVLGWLAWTLTEYLLHRYVFHWVGPQPWLRRFQRPLSAER